MQEEENLKNEISLIQSFKNVFSSSEGKKVLLHMAEGCFFNQTTLDINNPDPVLLAFREGQRSSILQILNTVNMPLSELIEELNKMRG